MGKDCCRTRKPVADEREGVGSHRQNRRGGGAILAESGGEVNIAIGVGGGGVAVEGNGASGGELGAWRYMELFALVDRERS